MSNSHAYLEQSALVAWRSKMATLNNDAIKLLNDYQNKVNELNNKFKNETNPMEQAKILNEILSLKGVKEWLKK